MKVILLQDVAKIGRKGQIVTVADGFAANALLPTKKAIIATADAVKRHEAAERTKAATLAASQTATAEALKRINGATVRIVAKASEKGSLFAKIHVNDIVAAITKQTACAIESSWMSNAETISEVGEYPIHIVFGAVQSTVTVVVASH